MLNHLHYADNHKKSSRRPMIMSRWSGYGSHRYPIGFSGDTDASWETLKLLPYFTATSANVLCSYWSHDVGVSSLCCCLTIILTS